ncbi:hypothetical protein AB0L80_38545 [Streptomyces sp. NPDC052069]|uniref:hypothetical protein n=1 Tax=Streptomyces sp. NPDC052069 TaxID=3154650 RepID=UPI003425D0F8
MSEAVAGPVIAPTSIPEPWARSSTADTAGRTEPIPDFTPRRRSPVDCELLPAQAGRGQLPPARAAKNHSAGPQDSQYICGIFIQLAAEQVKHHYDTKELPKTPLSHLLHRRSETFLHYSENENSHQFNPPYSYRVAEFIPGTETTPAEYVKVDQHTTISKIRSDQSLPDLVRFPSLEKMREEINRLRTDRAEQRAQRRKDRAQRQERESDQ